MELINGEQLKAIHTLLGKAGLKDEKDSIIYSFTEGRTTSSKKMMRVEAKNLITHLKSQDPATKAAEKMRNKIISLAHEMGWRIPNTDKIDIAHINNWCLTRGHVKKKLDDYTSKELTVIVTQFEQVYKAYLNGQEK
jgi:hypothetical protein